MKPYRIKHVPSGYYWTPGGKLSKIGKVFTDSSKDILSDKKYELSNSGEDDVCIYMMSPNSPIFKDTQDVIHWEKDDDGFEGRLATYHAHIPKDEWIREEVGTSGSYKVKHKKTGLYYAGNCLLNDKGKSYTNKSVLDDKGGVVFIADSSKTLKLYGQTKTKINWEEHTRPDGSVWYSANIPVEEFEKEIQ